MERETAGEKDLRNRIYWLNAVFSILVIWVHSFNAELFLGVGEEAAFVQRVEMVLGQQLGQIAVPGFFMISSFLFYRNFSWSCLGAKWKSRIKSVLIPYLLWNFLYYAAYAAASRLPAAAALLGKDPVPVTAGELARALILYAYNPVFWYLYQLILLIALAPLLYGVLKNVWSGGAVLALILLAIWKNWNFPHLNMDALFYYSAAAYWTLHTKKEGEGRRTVRTVLLLLGGLWLYLEGRPGSRIYMTPFYTVMLRFWGVCAVCFFAVLLPLPRAREWMKHSFFLYAIHFAWVRLINKGAALLLPAVLQAALGTFFLMPFFMVMISMILRKVMQAAVPGIYCVLSGGR